jgi:hypothetical protein
MAKNTTYRDAAVLQTNQLFVALKEIGHVNDKGRKIMSLGYGGRITAPPDRPLLAAQVVLENIADIARYSSDEAAAKDLQEFQAFVADLTTEAPAEPTDAPRHAS